MCCKILQKKLQHVRITQHHGDMGAILIGNHSIKHSSTQSVNHLILLYPFWRKNRGRERWTGLVSAAGTEQQHCSTYSIVAVTKLYSRASNKSAWCRPLCMAIILSILLGTVNHNHAVPSGRQCSTEPAKRGFRFSSSFGLSLGLSGSLWILSFFLGLSGSSGSPWRRSPGSFTCVVHLGRSPWTSGQR